MLVISEIIRSYQINSHYIKKEYLRFAVDEFFQKMKL